MLDIVAQCADANLIGITGHANPDGDCVASTLAMWQFLKKALPEKEIYVFLEKPPAIFQFIAGAADIIFVDDADKIPEDKRNLVCDVMIVLDTTADRTGNALPYVERAKKKINIDHHVSNEGEGDVYLVDPAASATAELVYELITCRPEYRTLLDRELAQTIYIGIIHDCGVMQYSNTSPKTLRIVADLVEYGFDFPKLIDETFYEKTMVQSKITGKAMLDAFPLLDGAVMATCIDLKTMREMGADKKDLSGIVNQLRIIKGVEVAVFAYETKHGIYKFSLRSCGGVDVAKVCAAFGGGGHVRAAGCTLEGAFLGSLEMIRDEIALQLDPAQINMAETVQNM